MQNKMLEGRGSCQVLILFVLTRFGPVHGPVLVHTPDLKRRGCLGDSIAILENIVFNSTGTRVSVYKTSAKHIQVIWHIQNGNLRRMDGHNERLVLDETGSVWIHRLNISDEASYTIQLGLGPSSKKYDITLEVIEPPTNNCKPNIKYDGTMLIAEPNIDECGKPPASVKWIQHSGTAISKHKIQPGNNNDIYIACIDGDSLSCAKRKNGIEFCSFYNKTTENSPCKSCETSTSTTDKDNFLRAMAIATFLVALAGIVLQIVQTVTRKKTSNQTYRDLVDRGNQTEETDVDIMSFEDGHLVNCGNQTEETDVDIKSYEDGHLVNHENQTEETDVDSMSYKEVPEMERFRPRRTRIEALPPRQ